MAQLPLKRNPEKLMLFLFPLITLSFFLLGVVVFTYAPQVYNYFF